jgi:predicted enzyme related to lactoylglutathione lyase
MLRYSPLFAGFAVNDISKAKEFYGKTLGLQLEPEGEFLAWLRAANGYGVLMYAKPTHRPAEHTILNFPVDDIAATVDALSKAGVKFEHYEGQIKTNDKGIAVPPPGRGPKQAWFRDPAGNILSVLEEQPQS